MEKFCIALMGLAIITLFAGFFIFGLPEYINSKNEEPIRMIDTIRIYEGIDTSYCDTIWVEYYGELD